MSYKKKKNWCSNTIPIKKTSKSISHGCLAWVRWKSNIWWPALVIKSSDCQQKEPKVGHFWVYWFYDHKISEALKKNMREFTSLFSYFFQKIRSQKQRKAVYEALELLALRSDYEYSNVNDLIAWAEKNFYKVNLKCIELPVDVLKHLNQTIISNNKDHLASGTMLSSVIPPTLKKVWNGLLKLEDMCIACYKEESIANHPLFIGGLCSFCRDTLIETIFAVGEDGKNIYCVICGKLGDLLLCDNDDCQCSYCQKCISVLVEEDSKRKILETSPWICFFCSSSKNFCALLEKKENWKENLCDLFNLKSPSEQLISPLVIRKPIRVLSLFDGISTGKLVLDSLGLAIDTYYASEVDENAIHVSKMHYSNSIFHVGDITSLSEEKIASMCPIDLVIGGSPCNDLSLVNPIRKGLYDVTGTGKLFFDFFHVLSVVRRMSKEQNVFFLYENVAAMTQSTKKIISSFLMQEPALIDARYSSGQIRPRYFWGNIPGLHSHSQVFYEEEYELKDYLLKDLGRKALVKKLGTVTTKRNSLVQNSIMPVEMNGVPDLLWITELEKLFGFPMHYTDTGNLSVSKRHELIGRSWSVPVIRKILSPLSNFFQDTKT